MLLALNCGFYNTKVKSSSGRYVHPTRVQENPDGTKRLVIDSTTYEIGSGLRDIGDKRTNNVHLICSKYNILKNATSENMSIITALPMNMYLNRECRENYRSGLLGRHTGNVDGLNKSVYVAECTVFAEGAAAYLPYKSLFKDKAIGILDIGGNTINAMIYSYGELQKDTITTLDLGMIKLERAMIDILNVRKGWNVQEYELREIMKEEDTKNIIDKCVDEHIRAIRQKLLEKKWNLDRLTLFCTGGGSIQLKDYLEVNFKNIIVSSNGLYDNVDGLWMAGGVLYAKNY